MNACTYEWEGGWWMDRWEGRQLNERMDKYAGGRQMSRWMNGWVGWKKKLKFVFFRTGHPIRLVLDREDDMLITGGRHPLFGKYKVSIKEENTKVPHFI